MSKNIAYFTSPGTPIPYGVSFLQDGINFTLFSRNAESVSLLLFKDVADEFPFQCIQLDPEHHRTGNIWHVCVHGARSGLVYCFQVGGPEDRTMGHRFQKDNFLLDPYATAIAPPTPWYFKRAGQENSIQTHAKCIAYHKPFDWEDDRPPKLHWSEIVIYEAHVRGMTNHPSSMASNPGTYLGVIDKIPYLKELGINAIELMPLQEFNPFEVSLINPLTHEPLSNYWGYSTVGFFAPHSGYGTGEYPGCQIDEFKQMVKALHKAGIEVLLDVVFNHTAEGDENGPCISFKGLDNTIYYLLEDDKRYYKNYSGCGNTINCNHPVVRNFILDCLRYWVTEMHVDGFRFDLASILGRDMRGELIPNPPLLEQIAEDPILHDIKLIAEAWDAGGAFQVGYFPGERWSEWNGHYRDDVRRFWRGDHGMIGALASRICGSADIYQNNKKTPINSINFITCHDGFTLTDLVSYRAKHNLANGEENRDGCDANHSDNYGIEGVTDNPQINSIRLKQKKNLLATLFLSRGIPMLLAGDEFGRTQLGNNNAYCQDNPVSWIDWSLLEQNQELFRFVTNLIAFRKQNRILSVEQFYSPHELRWFSADGGTPNWGHDQCLGCHIYWGKDGGPSLCLLFNPTPFSVTFQLPIVEGNDWIKTIDTHLGEGKDVNFTENDEFWVRGSSLAVADRSLVVLRNRARIS